MTIKEQALAHYRRMMLWAGMQKVERYLVYPDFLNIKIHEMLKGINENWYGSYCSYCQETDCEITNCKLGSSANCCDGLWNRLNHTISWREWINIAQMVYEYIEENG